jgi:hypothetical protein
MIIDKQLGIEAWVSYEDPRYPTLVLRSDEFGSIGYDLDLSTGNLSRVCICAAHSETECCCGAWSDADI